MRIYKHFWIGGMEGGMNDMKELENILEEIKGAALFMRTMSGYGAMCVSTGAAERIIRKHMNDGWIPVEEGVPEESEGDYYDSVIVTLSDGTVRPGVYRNREDEWLVENEEGVKTYRFSNEVIAWRPLPESYNPEKGCG